MSHVILPHWPTGRLLTSFIRRVRKSPLDHQHIIWTLLISLLTFSIVCFSGYFQSAINRIPGNSQGVFTYQDDPIITGQTQSEHHLYLHYVFCRLNAANVRINRAKSVFRINYLKCIGYVFDQIRNILKAYCKCHLQINIAVYVQPLDLYNITVGLYLIWFLWLNHVLVSKLHTAAPVHYVCQSALFSFPHMCSPLHSVLCALNNAIIIIIIIITVVLASLK